MKKGKGEGMGAEHGVPVRLSVIVPVHNGASVLDRCLESLAQSRFQDYECIVVDDASTDDTRAVAARHGVTLVALDQQGGPGWARNRGAERARGEILFFVDADVCVQPDTLNRVDAHFQQHPSVDALIGSYDDLPADRGFLSQFKNLFHHYIHQRGSPEGWTFWAGCGAIRRRVFLEIGGFDESYGRPSVEDIELGYRLRARHHTIHLNRDIQVTHLKRWTFWGLVRTDVRDRAIPWVLLMLRDRTMPSDLNVGISHRLSVALVYTLLLLCGTILAQRVVFFPIHLHTTLALASLALLLVLLNYDLYRFFARKRGLGFAAGALPLHWLYYFYCGLAVGAGLLLYSWGLLNRAQYPPGVARRRATP